MNVKLLLAKLFNKFRIYIILFVLLIIAVTTSNEFGTYGNITNLLSQMSIIGILAIGQTFVLLTGNFDLSQGSFVALGSVLIALTIPYSIAAAIGVTIVVLLLMGVFNAFFVNRGVVSFIVTLGMMGIARSVALFLADSDAIRVPNLDFKKLAYGTILDIPYSVFLWIALIVLFSIVLKHTRIGKYIYATGGNKESARLSGVNVKRVMYVVYLISAFCGAAASAVYTSRLGTALPDKAVGYEMDSIAAAVIGGTSMFGGVGTLWQTFVGVLIYGIITNYLNLMGVSAYWQQVVKGLMIALAVYLNYKASIKERRSQNAKE